MNAPFTEAETDWQKAVEGLSLASWRYAEALSKAGGDQAEAARLLWARSRHDKALREDLVKTACALFALAPAVPVGRVDAEPPIGWRRRPGRLSKCDRDQEVGAFVRRGWVRCPCCISPSPRASASAGSGRQAIRRYGGTGVRWSSTAGVSRKVLRATLVVRAS